MKVNPSAFRAYDIRGVVGKDITPKLADLVGKAFGTWLRSKSKIKNQKLKVVVGRDNRFSSDEIQAKFVEGLLSTGCDVTDAGLSLTPLIHFAVFHYHFDGGVIVTASHNPKEYNGFRFDQAEAMPVYNGDIQQIRKLVERESFIQGIGEITYKDIFPDYLGAVKKQIKIKRKLKVVLDCANGTPSKFAPELFGVLGCEVVKLFCNLDGDYPYHPPDPEKRLYLKSLEARVVEESADLGFAFDTDGDRFGVVDEQGTSYESDKILIVFARDLLKRKRGAKILFDIKSSYVLPEEVKKAGGVPIMMKTGHPYFQAVLAEDKDAWLGGETSSHTFFKENYFGFDDGLYAAAKLAGIVSRSKKPLSAHFADVKKTFHTEELKAPAPDEKKFAIVGKLAEYFKRRYDTIEMEGIRVLFSPTSWALIRASNTEPALSLRFEANSAKELKRIVKVVGEKLKEYPEVDACCLRVHYD